jgi:hypothetical protein
MKRHDGVTYSFAGSPLTAWDWRAQQHLDERDGIRCHGRSCKVCEGVRLFAETQARIHGIAMGPRGLVRA